MTPTKFPEQNIVFGVNQPEYQPLPAHRFIGDPGRRVAFCWSLTWRERLYLLVTGRVWHQVLTFGNPLMPQFLSVEKPDGMGGAISTMKH